MSRKYHLSPNGPSLCTASVVPCRFGDNLHHDTFGGAQEAYQEQLQKESKFLESSERNYGNNSRSQQRTPKIQQDAMDSVIHRINSTKNEIKNLEDRLLKSSEDRACYELALDNDNDLSDMAEFDLHNPKMMKEADLYLKARSLRKFEKLYPGMIGKDVELLNDTYDSLKSQRALQQEKLRKLTSLLA